MKGNQWGAADSRGRTIEEAYADLAGAICEKAYRDLVSGYRSHGRSDSTVRTIEKFFRSEWFLLLTDGTVDGEMVIQEAREARKRCRKSRRI